MPELRTNPDSLTCPGHVFRCVCVHCEGLRKDGWKAEAERLRQWKGEATEVILGLQDLGKALRLRLGTSITGRAAAEAAERWVTRAERAENALARVRELADEWQADYDNDRNGRNGYHASEYGDLYAADLRATLGGKP